jgi:hypothetical protein
MILSLQCIDIPLKNRQILGGKTLTRVVVSTAAIDSELTKENTPV